MAEILLTGGEGTWIALSLAAWTVGWLLIGVSIGKATERSGCGYHAPADVHGCAACDMKRIATERSGDE